jgi:hypothetical protein
VLIQKVASTVADAVYPKKSTGVIVPPSGPPAGRGRARGHGAPKRAFADATQLLIHVIPGRRRVTILESSKPIRAYKTPGSFAVLGLRNDEVMTRKACTLRNSELKNQINAPVCSLSGSWAGTAFIALSGTRRHCDHPLAGQIATPSLVLPSRVRRNARRVTERDDCQDNECHASVEDSYSAHPLGARKPVLFRPVATERPSNHVVCITY